MGRDISIAISARDNYTSAITTMRNSNQQFNKDLEGLTRKLNELNTTKISIKVDTDKARQSLKDAEKQFSKTGDAADELALKLANENYENARRNLDLVGKNARQAEKDILSMTDAVSRADNRVGGSSGAKGSTESGLASSLAKAGLGKMLGDSVSVFANASISSAFGSTTGDAISTTMSGAITGAAMGSMAGIPGAIAGAIAGTVSGGITAYTQNFQKEDDAFKSVVQSQIQNAQQKQDSDIYEGTSIAAKRQTDKTAFTSFLGGESGADDYLNELRMMDLTNPFSYDDLTSLSRTMFTYRMDTDKIKSLLNSIGDAGAATGMATEDMNMVAKTIGQLTQTATATRVDLNKLTDRGIPAIEYLAQAKGVTEEAIYGMLSNGGIAGKEAANIISEYLAKDTQFKGMALKQSETYLGQTSILEGLTNNLKAAYGEGYMEERTKGLKKETAFLSGSEAEDMKEAQRRIGEYKAYLENEKERIMRETLQGVMNSDEYKQLLSTADNETAPDEARIAAKANMGRLLKEAEIQAEADYAVSEGATIEFEAQKTMASNVREILKQDGVYKQFGYEMGLEFAKGLASVQGEIASALTPNLPAIANNKGFGGNRGNAPEMPSSWADRAALQYNRTPPGNAWGIPYVPRDDYITRLHEGERVLTASEARAQDKGGGSQLPSITGNNFHIREEADIYKIAQVLAAELKQAQQIT